MDRARYIILRIITFPFSVLPYTVIHKIGNALGLISFYLLKSFRKRALSNIALASDLKLDSKKIKSIAIGSFQNLMITCLEYAKLSREKDIHKIACCKNPEEAKKIMQDGKGVIFFCGHQANWEILFLEGTSRMPGVAIGKPVKNTFLYNWVLSIRQKFGGTIITPKNAIKEGLKALRHGKFLGIVGDQGMPDSGFCSPFLGRMAWTSPVPAILSYRTARPIIVAMTLRENGKYIITYSDPIWPDLSSSMENEIPRLMGKALGYLEKSIIEHPEQWLWQHNRWKQQLPGILSRTFRHDSLCVILPNKRSHFEKVVAALPAFRTLFPLEHLSFFAPSSYRQELSAVKEDIYWYEGQDELLLDDYRFKLVFNFSSNKKVKRHFTRRSAFHVLSYKDLLRLSNKTKDTPLSDILCEAMRHAR